MFESPLKILARLPPGVRLLVTGTLINKVGTFIVPYLTLVLLRDFHLSEGEAARLLFAYGVGSLVSILVGGALTDRLGRRATLMVSLFGSGVLAMAMGLAGSVRSFVPLLLVFGFVADLYRPAASAIVGDLLASHERATGFAALRLAVNLGFAFGMAVGGFIADWSWRWLFFGDGATTLLYGLVVLFFIPETQPERASDPHPQEAPAQQDSPWRDPVFLQMAFASFTFSLAFFSDVTVLPLTITVGAGYPAAVYGALVGLNGLIIALFEISAVAALKHHRRLRVAALGTALLAFGFSITGLWLHWGWFLLAILISTAGEILASPQQMSFVADWAPPRALGRYLGLYQATWSLSLAVSPALLLPLHGRLGEARFWVLLGCVAMPAALILRRLDRVADRPELLRGLSGPRPDPVLLGAIGPEG